MEDELMPTLLVCRLNVKKYYKINGFLLSKVAEADLKYLRDNLLSIIDSYESLVDQISDYSFVAQESNLNNYFTYTQ